MRATRLRRATAAALAVVAVAGLAACSGDQRPQVVVTTNILGDVVRQVVGDEVRVSVLMAPNADPHSFGLSARQAADLETADLVVHNGLGLEEGVARQVRSAEREGAATLAVGEEVDPLAYDRGDSRGDPDPHFWTDPARVSVAAELVRDAVVAEVDGVDVAAVERNAEAYLGELAELDDWMTTQLGSVPEPDRKLVTNHHVLGYLADRFGYEVVGAVVPSGTTLASPSASDLDSLAGAVRAAGVRSIFADTSQPDRLAQVLADEAGLGVRVLDLYSESLTAPGEGADSYVSMMRANTTTIVDGLTEPPSQQ
ncbi:zinc ABC transporter substrate-binding protein AztC [Solicola sp. PLA-1-18]|uniref:zinc ABC transporter substrate-binding protein AztC n=1 Tax=Solicola sp. PLA-1-18 TaxID=3380532 RepID=UPI003B7F0941